MMHLKNNISNIRKTEIKFIKILLCFFASIFLFFCFSQSALFAAKDPYEGSYDWSPAVGYTYGFKEESSGETSKYDVDGIYLKTSSGYDEHLRYLFCPYGHTWRLNTPASVLSCSGYYTTDAASQLEISIGYNPGDGSKVTGRIYLNRYHTIFAGKWRGWEDTGLSAYVIMDKYNISYTYGFRLYVLQTHTYQAQVLCPGGTCLRTEYSYYIRGYVDVPAEYYQDPTVSIESTEGTQQSHSAKFSSSKADVKIYYAWTQTACDIKISGGEAKCWFDLHHSTAAIEGTETSKSDDVTGEYYLQAKAVDKYGHQSDTVRKLFYFDNLPPSFISISPNGSSGAWLTSSVNIIVNYDDNHSGPKSGASLIEYCWSISKSSCSNEGDWTAGTPIGDPEKDYMISVSSEGKQGVYYLHVRGTDKAGTRSENETSLEYKIDSIAPESVIYTPESGLETNKVEITGYVSDEQPGSLLSGDVFICIAEVGTDMSGGFEHNPKDSKCKYFFPISSGGSYSKVLNNENITVGGEYKAVVKVFDNAGNTTYKESNSFILDFTAPVVTAVYDIDSDAAVAPKCAILDEDSGAYISMLETCYSKNLSDFNSKLELSEDISKINTELSGYKWVKVGDTVGAGQNISLPKLSVGQDKNGVNALLMGTEGIIEEAKYKLYVYLVDTSGNTTADVSDQMNLGGVSCAATNGLCETGLAVVYDTTGIYIETVANGFKIGETIVEDLSTISQYGLDMSMKKHNAVNNVMNSGLTAVQLFTISDVNLSDSVISAGLKTDKLTVSGTTTGCVTKIQVFGSEVPTVYNGVLTLTGCSGNGNVVVSVPQDLYSDKAGNDIRNTITFTVKIDNEKDIPRVYKASGSGIKQSTIYTTGEYLKIDVSFPNGYIIEPGGATPTNYPYLYVKVGTDSFGPYVSEVLDPNRIIRYSIKITDAMKGNLYFESLVYEYFEGGEYKSDDLSKISNKIVDEGGNVFDYANADVEMGLKDDEGNTNPIVVNMTDLSIVSVDVKLSLDSGFDRLFANKYSESGGVKTIYVSGNLYIKFIVTFIVYKGVDNIGLTKDSYEVVLGGTEETPLKLKAVYNETNNFLNSCTLGVASEGLQMQNGFVEVIQEINCTADANTSISQKEATISIEEGFVRSTIATSLTNDPVEISTIKFLIDNKSESMFEDSYFGVNGTREIIVSDNDYYYSDGSNINNFCEYTKNLGSISCAGSSASGNTITLRNLAVGNNVIEVADIYNKYGVKEPRATFVVVNVDSSSVKIEAEVAGNSVGHYIEMYGSGTGSVVTFYYFVEGETISSDELLASTLSYKLTITAGNSTDKITSLNEVFVRVDSSGNKSTINKDYDVNSHTIAIDPISPNYNDINSYYQTGSEELTYVTYNVTFASGITKTIVVNLVKYDSSKISYKLESITNSCSWDSSSTSTECTVNKIYGSELDMVLMLVDNNTYSPYIKDLLLTDTASYQDLVKENNSTITISSVENSKSAGVIKGRISVKAKITSNNALNRAKMDYEIKYDAAIKTGEFGYITITGEDIPVSTMTITLVSREAAYVPISWTGVTAPSSESDYEAYEYYCDALDGITCYVNIEDGAVPQPLWFKLENVSGVNYVNKTSSLVEDNGIYSVTINDMKFIFIANNLSPVISGVTGPFDATYCSDEIASLVIGNKMCLLITVVDDAKNNQGDAGELNFDVNHLKLYSAEAAKFYIERFEVMSVSDKKTYAEVESLLAGTLLTQDKLEAKTYYEYTVKLIMFYQSDTREDKYDYDGEITIEKGAIKDGFGYTTTKDYDGVTISLSLVPTRLKLLNATVEGDSFAGIYYKDYSVLLEFNKVLDSEIEDFVVIYSCFGEGNAKCVEDEEVIEPEEEEEENYDFKCTVVRNASYEPTAFMRCSKSSFIVAGGLADGEHTIKVKKDIAIKDVDGVEWQSQTVFSNLELAKITYDTVGPKLSVNGETDVGEFDVKTGFEIVLNINDSLSGIPENLVDDFEPKVQVRNDSNVDHKFDCAIKVFDYKNYTYHIIVDNCAETEVSGTVWVDFGVNTIQDNLGNYSSATDNLIKIETIKVLKGGVELKRYKYADALGKECKTDDVCYLNENGEITLELTFESTISSLTIGMIADGINATSKNAYITSRAASGNVVSLKIKVYTDSGNDLIRVKIDAGAVYYQSSSGKIKYDYEGIEINLDNVKVLVGKYTLSYDSIVNEGCVSDAGLYYCNTGDIIKLYLRTDRKLNLSSGEMKIIITIGAGYKGPNGEDLSATRELIGTSTDGELFEFVYEVEGSVNGPLALVEHSNTYKDAAGNGSMEHELFKKFLSDGIANYVIITTVTSWNDGEVFNAQVSLGTSYVEFRDNIISQFGLASYTLNITTGETTCEIDEGVPCTIEDMLINGDLFAYTTESIELLFNVTDKAQNTSTLIVDLKINFGGDVVVAFNNVVKAYDGLNYGSEYGFNMTLPAQVEALDSQYMGGALRAELESRIKGKISEAETKNAGTYVIRIDSSLLNADNNLEIDDKSRYLNGEYKLVVINGSLTVEKVVLAVNNTNCRVIDPNRTFGDSLIILDYDKITCDGVVINGVKEQVTLIGNIQIIEGDVGESNYQVKEIRVKDNNNYTVPENSYLSNTMTTQAYEIDIREHVFNEINQYYDGTKEVLVTSGEFRVYYGGALYLMTISWDSGVFEVGNTWDDTVDQVVTLKNPRIIAVEGNSPDNFTIGNKTVLDGAEYITAKGKLKANDTVFNVGMSYSQGGQNYKSFGVQEEKVNPDVELYTNSAVDFKIDSYYGYLVDQYNAYKDKYVLRGITSAAGLFTHTWYECEQRVVSVEGGAYVFGEGCSKIEGKVDIGNHSVSKATYVYLKLEKPMGGYKVVEMKVNYEDGPITIDRIYLSPVVNNALKLDEKAPLTSGVMGDRNTFSLNETIVVVLDFNREVYVKSGTTIQLQGNKATYTLRYASRDGDLAAFTYEVSNSDSSDYPLKLKMSEFARLDDGNVYDDYGNVYDYQDGTVYEFYKEDDKTYNIEIDRSSAVVTNISFVLDGREINAEDNRYYINSTTGANKQLTLTITFSETGIITYPTAVIINSNNSSTPITLAYASGVGTNKLVYTASLSSSSLKNQHGVLEITDFEGEDSMVYFENRSIKLIPGNSLNGKVTSSVYVDNLEFTMTLEGPAEVTDEAVINFTCNKAEFCLLEKENISVLLNNGGLNVLSEHPDNVVIDNENKTITISGLKEILEGLNITAADLVVSVNKNTKTDLAGNKLSNSPAVTINVDILSVRIVNVEVSTSCVGKKCKKDQTIVAKVIFNKDLVNVNTHNSLLTTNEDVVFVYAGSSGRYIEFIYKVAIENVEEEIVLSALTLNVKDDVGNELDSLDIPSDYRNTGVRLDTKRPELIVEDIESVGVGCTAEGVCNLNSQIKVRLSFTEAIYSYGGITIVSNFGKFEYVMNANVNSTMIEYVIDVDNNIKVELDKFIITKIVGNFDDEAGNTLAYSNENASGIHTNESISLDPVAPGISSMVISGGNEVNGVKYFKGGETITVTVHFNDTISNIGEVELPTMTINLSNGGGNNLTKAGYTSGNSYIVYTFAVGVNDSGNLSTITMSGNNELKDSAGNIVNLTLPGFDGTSVYVDKEDFEVDFINVSQNSASGSAVIKYYCNKQYANCSLSGNVTSNFEVKKNGAILNGVTLTANGENITITGLVNITASDVITVQMKANSMYDYTGRGNKVSEVLTIGIDSSSIGILYSSAITVTPSSQNCVNGVCKKDAILLIKVPFTKDIKKAENVKLAFRIGDNEELVYSEAAYIDDSFANRLVFKYVVGENHQGLIKPVRIEGKVEGVSGNPSEETMTIKDVILNDVMIDSLAPSDNIVVESSVSGCNEEICKVKVGNVVKVTVKFDEYILEYTNLVVESNFGTLEGMLTQVKSDYVVFNIVITETGLNDASFVITRISGNFFDVIGNELKLNKVTGVSVVGNVHENENIVLDSKAPSIENVEISSCNRISEDSCVNNVKVRENDEIEVRVVFDEILLNTEVAKNRARLELTFNNLGLGEYTSEVELDEVNNKTIITYTYVVASGDNGKLRKVELIGGYLEDSVGNTIDYDNFDFAEITCDVEVDNTLPSVDNVTVDKNNEATVDNIIYVKNGDEVAITVVFSEPVSGETTMHINGSEEGISGVRIDSKTIRYAYVVGDIEGKLNIEIRGNLEDDAHNTIELPYVYSAKEIIAINSGNELVVERVKEVVTPTDVGSGNVLVYRIANENEYTFDSIYELIKGKFSLMCAIGEGEFTSNCIKDGIAVNISMTLEVVKDTVNKSYNIYWKPTGSHVYTYTSTIVRLKLVENVNASNLVDLANNDISLSYKEENTDIFEYDNVARKVESYSFVTNEESKIGSKYYVVEGSVITVNITFNEMLANGMGEMRGYPLVVKFTDNIKVEMETNDGLNYSGEITVIDLTGICGSNVQECMLSASIISRDLVSGDYNNYVTGSNNRDYTLEAITETNLYYDNVAPVVTVSHNHVNNIVKDEINLTFTCVDNGGSAYGSGCSSITVQNKFYSFDNKGKVEVKIENEESNVALINYVVRDELGNRASGEISFVVDKVAPTITIKDSAIIKPIKSEGNAIEVEVTDALSDVLALVGVCYTWDEDAECIRAELTNGKVSINVPEVDGTYRLFVKGAKDSLGNEVIDYVVSKEITIDNSVPVLDLANKVISANTCVEDNGTIYCGSGMLLDVNIPVEEASEIVTKVVESNEFNVYKVEVKNGILSFVLGVKSTVNAKDMVVFITLKDALGHEKIETVSLDNVVIDVTDNGSLTYKLDNSNGKKGTMIESLEVTNDEYAPIREITCTVSDYASCNLEYLKERTFDRDTTIVITYRDLVGNGKSETIEIKIDGVAPKLVYKVLDNIGNGIVNAMEAYEVNGVRRVFDSKVGINLVDFNENIKYNIYSCNLEYTECSEIVTSAGFLNVEQDKGQLVELMLSEGINYIKVVIEDEATNRTEYTLRVKQVAPELEYEEETWKKNHEIKVNGYEEYAVVTYKITTASGVVESSIVNGRTKIQGETFEYNGKYNVTITTYLTKTNSESHYKETSIELWFDNEIRENDFDVEVLENGERYDGTWTRNNVVVRVIEKENSLERERSKVSLVEVGNKACTLLEGDIYECVIGEDTSLLKDEYVVKVYDNAGNHIELDEIEFNIDKEGYRLRKVSLNNGYKKVHTVRFTIEGTGAGYVETLWMLILKDKIAIEEVKAENFVNDYYGKCSEGCMFGVDIKQGEFNRTLDDESLNGEYYLFVYTLDEADNKEIISTELKFDNAGPEIIIDNVAGEYATYSMMDGHLVDSLSNRIAIISDAGVNAETNSSIVVKYVFEREGVEYTNVNLLEGEYTLIVTATDTLGNKSENRSTTMLIDNVGPKVELANKATNDNPTFTVADGIVGVNWSEIKYCIYRDDSSICNEGSLAFINIENYKEEDNSFSVTLENISELGNVNVVIKAVDNIGNVSYELFEIYYDDESPNVEVLSVTDGNKDITFENRENELTEITGFTNTSIYVVISIRDFAFNKNVSVKNYLKACFVDDILRQESQFDTCNKGYTDLMYNEENGYYTIKFKIDKLSTDSVLNGYLNVFVEDLVGNITIRKVYFNDNISLNAPSYNLVMDEKPGTSKVINVNFATNIDDVEDGDITYKECVATVAGANLEAKYNNCEGSAIELAKDNLSIEVNENNKLFIVKVTNKWGNTTYKSIVVNSLDKEAPRYEEGKDFALSIIDSGNGEKLYKEEYEENTLVRYTLVNSSAVNGNIYLYNKGKLSLVFVGGTIKDSVLEGYNRNQKVVVEICIGETCKSVEIGLNASGLSNETSVVLNDLFAVAEFEEGITRFTYKVMDEAGNEVGEERSFEVRRNTEVVSTIEVEENNDESKWLNSYKVSYNKVLNSLLVESVEFYFEGSACKKVVEAGTETEITCSDLDATYTLKYRIKDILGYEREVEVASNVSIDTISPNNSDANVIEFKLHKNEAGKYYLSYEVVKAELIETEAKVEILYADNSKYCTIAAGTINGDCSVIDESKFVNTEINFKTIIIDKAGNVSAVMQEYTLEYDNSRQVIVKAPKYDDSSKIITVDIIVDNPYNGVSKYEISIESASGLFVKSSEMSSICGTLTRCKLQISERDYSDLFEDGFINKKLQIKVFDNYETVEAGLELGQIGPAQEVELIYDTNDPIININASSIIKSDVDNTFTFNVTNKGNVDEGEATVVKTGAIIQKMFGANGLVGVTKDNFATTCMNYASTCINERYIQVSNNEVKLKANTNLDTGTYRLAVFVEDSDGNRAISIEEIVIDNTAPVFKIVNSSNIDDYNDYEDYKVYKDRVFISVSDDESKNYTGKVVSFVMVDKKGNETPVTIKTSTYSIALGGSSDGEYLLRIADEAGNVREQKIIVDTSNSGYTIVDSSGNEVNTESTVQFTKGTFEDLHVEFAENMRGITFEFKEGDATRLLINVKDGVCEYTTNKRQYKSCSGNVEEIIKLGANESIKLSSILELARDVELTDKVKQLKITSYNVSMIDVYDTISLDFEDPSITVYDNLEKKKLTPLSEIEVMGEKVVCKDIGGKIHHICYMHNSEVVTNGSETTKIESIVRSYIKKVDTFNSYSATINNNDRLRITIYDMDTNEVVAANVQLSDPSWHLFIEIMKNVGRYLIKYDYSDAAGNEAASVYLLLNVDDTKAPVVVNFNNIKMTNNVVIDDSEGNEYKVLEVKATDEYGFDRLGEKKEEVFYNFKLQMLVDKSKNTYADVEFMLEEGVYVGRRDGKVYVIRSEEEGKVVYKFVKEATYQIVYDIKDYKGNPSKSFIVKVEVKDKHAPIMEENNDILVRNNNYIELEGEGYTIQEDANGVRLENAAGEVVALVEKGIFEINGKRYELDKNAGKVYRVLNINNGKLCFVEDEECDIRLNEITARDEEDEAEVEVNIKSIIYSETKVFGNVETPNSYREPEIKEGLFKVASVEFTKVGYYKVVFASKDSKGNEREVIYVIRVEDTDKPEFRVDNQEVNEEEVYLVEVEYDNTIKEVVKGTNYPGKNEAEKIASYIEKKWIVDHVTSYDNYRLMNVNKYYDIEEVRMLDELEGKEYLKYRVVLRAEDSSNNVSIFNIEFIVVDTTSPENGKIEISYDGIKVEEIEGKGYTKSDNIYFRLSEATDITGKVSYEYRVIINGIQPREWQTYEGGFELGYSSIEGETNEIKIEYRVKDSVPEANVSISLESDPVVVDRIIPTMLVEVIEGEEAIEVAEGEGYQGDNVVRITFRDDIGSIEVKGYRNNKEIVNRRFVSHETIEIQGFGHYKFIAKDLAGNEYVREMIIMPSDNKFNVIDNTMLNNALNAAVEEKQFDMVILQKITSDGNSFYFEDMSLIGDKDNVYLMGVVPDKEGAIFSIYSSGAISGEVFKGYETYFPINTSSNIVNINPGYATKDYLINYKGEKYILVAVEKDGYSGPSVPDNEEDDNSEQNTSSASFTWVFYILGGAGAVGGIFLIMRLRKRVRAA